MNKLYSGALLLASLVSLPLSAQDDLTATLLANPSFEDVAANCTESVKVTNDADGLRGWNVAPTGWNVPAVDKALRYIITADCFTDNNFGKSPMADGEYAFYSRVGWDNVTNSVSQTTLQDLAVGTYELSFKSKAAHASGSVTANYAVSDGTNSLAENSFSSVAGSSGCMASLAWDTRKLRFPVAEAGKVTITITNTFASGGACILLDDFRIVKVSDNPADASQEEQGGTEDQVESPTEGKLDGNFVPESQMMSDLKQMLANFMPYCKGIFTDAGSVGDLACGYFKANSAGQSNEDGVRTNADLAMICAFVATQAGDMLPPDISVSQVRDMAMKALVYGYSTHKANKKKQCTNNAYWGSTSSSDSQWESSLWTMSLAFASHFLAVHLTQAQKDDIYNMIKAECNYELQRSIPTGYAGDTKAEENGWEVNILACALGLYPDDELAPKWFERMRQFAINCYSHSSDANDKTVIDPDYDNKTVADLYLGQNLYDDYTLQNHNYFHTSYQNVVIQELGESAVALALFQGADPKWKSNALMHNNQAVMDNVLKYLAVADGELAMPNGNDWSMFLFDQITSYSTVACFLGDAEALLLENLAYRNIQARQTTTSDGSWLLHSDIGPRRMGVEAHRVMMTYLMHELNSTAGLTAPDWNEFSAKYQDAYRFPAQNLVRAASDDRTVFFSWSSGLGNYQGYFVPNDPNLAKIVVPYKANNAGNILGWYNVSGKDTNTSASIPGIYEYDGNAFVMNGEVTLCGNSLRNSFALYTTPKNALIYLDNVAGITSGTVSRDCVGMLGISTDPFTKQLRTIYNANGRYQGNGSEVKTLKTNWANVDNAIGVVNVNADKSMAFGEASIYQSINTSKLYPLYNAANRAFEAGETVDRHALVYYSGVNAETTKALAEKNISLRDKLADGWNGVIVADPDGSRYVLVSNFAGAVDCSLAEVVVEGLGAPLFPGVLTTVSDKGSAAEFRLDHSRSVAAPLNVYIPAAAGFAGFAVKGDNSSAVVTNNGVEGALEVTIVAADGTPVKGSVTFAKGETRLVKLVNGAIVSEAYQGGSDPDAENFFDITEGRILNNGFELDQTYGKVGSGTLGGVTYDPCYLNETSPVSSKFIQVLPIQNWTNASKLDGESKFAVLYSMPYSETMYCFSPSDKGNSVSIISAPALFSEVAATRCLSVLNSWTFGNNAIEQKVTLPADDYKLKFLARYVCANEMSREADNHIKANGNDNYSLCGVRIGSEEFFTYPSQPNVWEEITIPFTLAEEKEVTVSMGLKTTASVGAANNTRLYLDNVRLFAKTEPKDEPVDDPSSVALLGTEQCFDVFTLQGFQILKNAPGKEVLALPAGMYIVNNRKIIIR